MYKLIFNTIVQTVQRKRSVVKIREVRNTIRNSNSTLIFVGLITELVKLAASFVQSPTYRYRQNDE